MLRKRIAPEKFLAFGHNGHFRDLRLASKSWERNLRQEGGEKCCGDEQMLGKWIAQQKRWGNASTSDKMDALAIPASTSRWRKMLSEWTWDFVGKMVFVGEIP